MILNTYFIPRRDNRPHATPKCGPEESKFKIDYYTQLFLEKLDHIRETFGKIRSRSNVLFKTNKFQIYTVFP